MHWEVDGARMRALREARKWTRADISWRLAQKGVRLPVQRLYWLESGRSRQALSDTLYYIARELEVPMDELMRPQAEQSA